MRIVGGKFGGRTLTSPNDFRVRPTAEEVRVHMMKLLRNDLEGARVLDLFAGTGALGLEALSRGAKYVDFVEFRPASLHALQANIKALRVTEKTRVYKKDALPFADTLPPDRYDVAFADPPYESRMLDRLIERWQRAPWSRILVAEHATTHQLPRAASHARFEETAISVYRAVADQAPASRPPLPPPASLTRP
ncbi:MAG: RsmD family RNA methyltransferase [Gemmatimonas sp.]|jgi:16S rRNA (guanine966-N2)-methyltransferase|uniref:RsmD family RNA methyltransferase n=1 Tax=Gemmatimonas sp. TaxID=1962908 RepID=UPI0022C29E5F|nr:RsmD family RNA methyltransferase [Gemmatimonas sp.]MCA2988334.1 RsmD family RNA methyltransferase [Gemmatimonas sp.]MCZ8011141.1 RsmD family RNA methyltransferase [Gemmatimonas sp.]MCZ8266038.1 RsmD family RNA methyltransferase [Gemmatimonas sp.]